jgi:hypothetical protein
MTTTMLKQEAVLADGKQQQGILARHIRFVVETPSPAQASESCEFQPLRPSMVADEFVAPAELSAPAAWPEPTDSITILLVPTERAAEARKLSDSFMAMPDNPEAVANIVFTMNAQRIQWRPGRALIQGVPDGFESTVDALIVFAWYEGELRRLDRLLEKYENDALADTALAYAADVNDRKRSLHFRQMSELLTRMRLMYARLEPHLTIESRALPRAARSITTRLFEEAVVDERLETF